MNHAEAFKLMTYGCQGCGFREVIWNSRDGVTPFGVDCRRCGEGSLHIEWGRDVYAPDHNPARGDRYFRDGLLAEARAIMRRRLESGKGTAYEVPEETWESYMPTGTTEDGEFQLGWPMLVVRGTDADALDRPLHRRTERSE